MAYDTTEAVAKFLSGFQMKITNRERDTVAPDYYVKYSLTLSKGGKDFSTTFVSDGEPTVTQVFSALADDALTLRKYSTDMMRIMRRPMTRRIPSSRLSTPRSRRNMAKTSPTVPTTSYRTTMISRGA